MNNTITLDEALDAAMSLTDEEREMLVEILRRRKIDDRRTEIAGNAKEAVAVFHSDETKPETATELIDRLHAATNQHVLDIGKFQSI